MKRSSTMELFTPFKDPEREFRSSRKHFKTLSLDESRSPDFDLFSNQEEYSEEEELQTNPFSGSDHEDANEHIEKVLKIMDLFHIPNITIDQVMLRAFLMSLTGAKVNEKVYANQVGCEQCKGSHYTKDCPFKEEGKTLEEAYYTQFGAPFQGGVIEKLLRDSTKGTMQNLQANVSVMPLSTYLNLGLGELAHTKLTVELAYKTVKYPKGITENVLVGISKFVFPVDFIILDMPEYIKVPLILGRSFLSTSRAKIDVFKRKISLRVWEERIIFKSVKPASNLTKRVYMLELNNLNVPLELRRDQVDDLMPTIEEDFVVLEDMDAYRDKGMGDVIFGEPFLREVGINAKRFEGMVTIHNGNEEVTYQMVRSHPRTSLKEKKSTMLVENLRSGNFEVLES
ncbi:putative reverse transcriptase domain-containing protein [Tanacetum coccineum]